MVPGSLAIGAPGYISHRNRDKIRPTSRSSVVGALAPEPVPAASRKLPKSLLRPASLQRLYNNRSGTARVILGTHSARRQAQKNPTKCPFTLCYSRSKDTPDELKGFIPGLFGYHPKLGCYADLHNHLLSFSNAHAKGDSSVLPARTPPAANGYSCRRSMG